MTTMVFTLIAVTVSAIVFIIDFYLHYRTPTIGTIYVEEDGLFYCSIDSEKDLERLKGSKDVRFRVRIKK